jgi:hypothetical protein
MREVLDAGVRAREHEALVPVVAPPHDVRRGTVLSVNREDLRVPLLLADAVSLDDQPVTDRCTHRLLLSPWVTNLAF